MIDVNILRKTPEIFKQILASGRGDPRKADIDKWLELDKKRSNLIQQKDEINHKRNELAKLGANQDIEKIREEGKYLKVELQKVEEELNNVVKSWQEILDWMPNIPLEPMPEGKGENDNIVVKLWTPKKGYVKEAIGKKSRGETEKYMPEIKDFTPKHHLDIGEELKVIDIIQGGKVSGSRFTYLLGDLVLLQYGIQQLLFNELIKKGYKPIIPPLLVKERALYGSSHFPEGRNQVYSIQADNVEEGNQLFLVGSTEPANFAYFMDKVFNIKELPIKVFAYAPAFRSEAGSWGRDLKGISRLHQFDKIEMNAVTSENQSMEVFWEFMGINEWLLQILELPYQLSKKCSGDAGYLASSVQIDPEVWLPGQKKFMEVMTDTNTTDYQARRLNIKYKDDNNELKFAHTVNDTGCAMGRILISIIENYQQKDGSINIPSVLQKIIKLKSIKNK